MAIPKSLWSAKAIQVHLDGMIFLDHKLVQTKDGRGLLHGRGHLPGPCAAKIDMEQGYWLAHQDAT